MRSKKLGNLLWRVQHLVQTQVHKNIPNRVQGFGAEWVIWDRRKACTPRSFLVHVRGHSLSFAEKLLYHQIDSVDLPCWYCLQ